MMADNGDLEGARQLLVEELDTLSAMRGWTVTVSSHLITQARERLLLCEASPAKPDSGRACSDLTLNRLRSAITASTP